MERDTGKIFQKLVEICARLRGENGCLWDKKQTHESLIKYLEEESREVIEAIKNKDDKNLKEELGDLLYQIIFHSQLGSEENKFTIYEVIENIVNKIIRRHPHVFENTKVYSVEDILRNWEEIKKKEKEQ